MKISALIIFYFSILLTGIRAEGENLKEKINLEKLTEIWKFKSNSKLEVIYISEEKMMRSAVTPDDLKKWCDYRLEIAHPSDSSIARELRSVIIKSKFNVSTYTPDIRWGFILTDNDTHDINFEIYMGKGAEDAIVNGFPVRFDGQGKGSVNNS